MYYCQWLPVDVFFSLLRYHKILNIFFADLFTLKAIIWTLAFINKITVSCIFIDSGSVQFTKIVQYFFPCFTYDFFVCYVGHDYLGHKCHFVHVSLVCIRCKWLEKVQTSLSYSVRPSSSLKQITVAIIIRVTVKI